MKIFGFSAMSLFVLILFFWIGTKFPNAFANVPIIGKM